MSDLYSASIGEVPKDILTIIAAWYNSYYFKAGEKSRNIAYSMEPSLPTLFNGVGWTWNHKHREALDDLYEKSILERGYVAGNKINWRLTQTGVQLMKKLFDDRTDVVPDHLWYDRGVQGDPNELLTHRKGVMAAYERVRQYNDVQQIIPYPTSNNDKPAPDLYVEFDDQVPKLNGEIEVLTNCHNQPHWINKWTQLTKPNRWTFYIVESRRAACAFLNTIHHSSETDLVFEAGEFSTPYNNWPPQRINERLEKAIGPNCRHDACVWTLQSLISMNHAEMRDLLIRQNPSF